MKYLAMEILYQVTPYAEMASSKAGEGVISGESVSEWYEYLPELMGPLFFKIEFVCCQNRMLFDIVWTYLFSNRFYSPGSVFLLD
jgi:hypothetical protein